MPYLQSASCAMIRKRAGWLAILFVGEMLTATAHGRLRGRDRAGGRARPLRAAHHLERRQLGLPGLDPGHPRDGARRGAPRATGGASCGARWPSGLTLGVDPGGHRPRCGSSCGRRCSAPTARTTAGGGDGRAQHRGRGVPGAPSPARCCPSCCARLGFDPASASAPFVATLVDVCGLLIYFTVARFVMAGTLL